VPEGRLFHQPHFVRQPWLSQIAARVTPPVGEKFLDPDLYATGEGNADNSSMFQGFDRDVNRWAGPDCPPLQDVPGIDFQFNFGSAHAVGFYMTFCDGSTQFINYSIDLEVHRRLANRGDGLPIDASKL
jgi:hypothetical protein